MCSKAMTSSIIPTVAHRGEQQLSSTNFPCYQSKVGAEELEELQCKMDQEALRGQATSQAPGAQPSTGYFLAEDKDEWLRGQHCGEQMICDTSVQYNKIVEAPMEFKPASEAVMQAIDMKNNSESSVEKQVSNLETILIDFFYGLLSKAGVPDQENCRADIESFVTSLDMEALESLHTSCLNQFGSNKRETYGTESEAHDCLTEFSAVSSDIRALYSATYALKKSIEDFTKSIYRVRVDAKSPNYLIDFFSRHINYQLGSFKARLFNPPRNCDALQKEVLRNCHKNAETDEQEVERESTGLQSDYIVERKSDTQDATCNSSQPCSCSASLLDSPLGNGYKGETTEEGGENVNSLDCLMVKDMPCDFNSARTLYQPNFSKTTELTSNAGPIAPQRTSLPEFKLDLPAAASRIHGMHSSTSLTGPARPYEKYLQMHSQSHSSVTPSFVSYLGGIPQCCGSGSLANLGNSSLNRGGPAPSSDFSSSQLTTLVASRQDHSSPMNNAMTELAAPSSMAAQDFSSVHAPIYSTDLSKSSSTFKAAAKVENEECKDFVFVRYDDLKPGQTLAGSLEGKLQDAGLGAQLSHQYIAAKSTHPTAIDADYKKSLTGSLQKQATLLPQRMNCEYLDKRLGHWQCEEGRSNARVNTTAVNSTLNLGAASRVVHDAVPTHGTFACQNQDGSEARFQHGLNCDELRMNVHKKIGELETRLKTQDFSSTITPTSDEPVRIKVKNISDVPAPRPLGAPTIQGMRVLSDSKEFQFNGQYGSFMPHSMISEQWVGSAQQAFSNMHLSALTESQCIPSSYLTSDSNCYPSATMQLPYSQNYPMLYPGYPANPIPQCNPHLENIQQVKTPVVEAATPKYCLDGGNPSFNQFTIPHAADTPPGMLRSNADHRSSYQGSAAVSKPNQLYTFAVPTGDDAHSAQANMQAQKATKEAGQAMPCNQAIPPNFWVPRNKSKNTMLASNEGSNGADYYAKEKAKNKKTKAPSSAICGLGTFDFLSGSSN